MKTVRTIAEAVSQCRIGKGDMVCEDRRNRGKLSFQGVPVVMDEDIPEGKVFLVDQSKNSWWSNPIHQGPQTFDYTAELDAQPVDNRRTTERLNDFMVKTMNDMQKDVNEQTYARGMPDQIITSKDVFEDYAAMIGVD